MKKIFLILLIIIPITICFNFAKAEWGCTGSTDCVNCGDKCSDTDLGCTGTCPSATASGDSSRQCCAVDPCTKIMGSNYNCVTITSGANSNAGSYECADGNKWYCKGADNINCCKQKQQPATTQTPTIKDVGGTNLFDGVSTSCVPDQSQPGECTTADFVIVAMNATNLLLGIIAALALLFFIVAGIKMVISQGNSEQISSAKSMMLNSVIGIVIALCSFLIVRFVQDAIGLKDKVYNESIKIEGTINPK